MFLGKVQDVIFVTFVSYSWSKKKKFWKYIFKWFKILPNVKPVNIYEIHLAIK